MAREEGSLTPDWLTAGAASTGAALVLTGVVRRWAIHRAVIDRPGHRSSHWAPTPRGGGIAIVAAIGIGMAVAGAGGLDTAILAIAAFLMVVGIVDDMRGLDYRVKLTAQIATAAALIVLVGESHTLAWPAWSQFRAVDVPSWLALLMTVTGIVGFTNAFNFIDGIDGIAALLAVIATAAVAALNAGSDVVLPMAAAGACLGFLPYNRHPARVFMGDAGSLPLGFLIAALAVTTERRAGVPASLVALCTFPIAVDVASTLVLRAARREPLWMAHRDHAYQVLVRSGWSHGSVTALYAVLAACAAFAIVAAVRGWIPPVLWWVAASPTVVVIIVARRGGVIS